MPGRPGSWRDTLAGLLRFIGAAALVLDLAPLYAILTADNPTVLPAARPWLVGLTLLGAIALYAAHRLSHIPPLEDWLLAPPRANPPEPPPQTGKTGVEPNGPSTLQP